MVAPVITALPTAPDIADPANFATDASTFVAALAPLQSEINSFGTYLNAGTDILGRNLLFNGSMRVAQRGTSFAAPQGYTLDRWKSIRFSSGDYTVSQQGTGGLADFPYCSRMQRNTGTTSTNEIAFNQAVEQLNCTHVAGKNVTLSFWVRVGSDYSGPGGDLRSAIAYTTSATDIGMNYENFSASGTTTTQVITASTSWTYYTQTVAIPSTAKQVGVGFTTASWSGTAGAADYYDITGVQLEVGSAATDFEHRSYGQELALCQRYYETGQHYRSGAIATGTSGPETSGYAVTKRAGATMTITPTALINFTGVTLFGNSESHFTTYPTGGTSGAQGRYAINWTSDGEL